MSRFKIKGDPLLTVAAIGIVITEIMIVFAMVILVISVGAIFTHRAKLLAELAAAGGPASAFAGTLLSFGVILAMLLLSLCFVIQLKRIVATVGEGDPFQSINASRLALMGWCAAGMQIGHIALSPLSAHLGRYPMGAVIPHLHTASAQGPATGFALAIVLFILARVFRRGTEMREELEGTV